MREWVRSFYNDLLTYIDKKRSSQYWPTYERTAKMIREPAPADEEIMDAIIDGLDADDRDLAEELFKKGKTVGQVSKERGHNNNSFLAVHIRNLRERVCACIGYYIELGMVVMPSRHIAQDFHKELKAREENEPAELLFERCYFGITRLSGQHDCKALHEAYCENGYKCKFFRPLDYRSQNPDGYVRIASKRRKGMRL